MINILVIIGTRPEAIKMATLIKLLRNNKAVNLSLCTTGQHKEMLEQVLSIFEIKPDYELNIMHEGQDLFSITSAILHEIKSVIQDFKPDRIFVHGDTSTTFVGALAAYYSRVEVCHVEAGLRTHNMLSPWPEEGNRRLVSVVCSKHYAPTIEAKNNLLKEGIQESNILVTGNTVIDSLLYVNDQISSSEKLRNDLHKKHSYIDKSKDLILITGHRRENFGDAFKNICLAIQQIAQRPDVQIVFPVHMNPNVKGPVHEILGDEQNIHLIEPQEYVDFIFLMTVSKLIVTDSGGVQEEAPTLNKPVLVMRDTTERPEAVVSGAIKIVGTDKKKIIDNVFELLDNPDSYNKMSSGTNPYGDGKASQRIIEDITQTAL